MRARGEMPEWPNGIDSKSIVAAMPPRVRIPVSPPFIKPSPRLGFLFLGPWPFGQPPGCASILNRQEASQDKALIEILY